MPFKPVEFEFPNPDNGEAVTEGAIEVVIEGNPTTEPIVKKEAKAPEVEIEIVDDRPVADRDKKKGKPPEELTDEELENYSERVQKRLKHFSKGFHDQRREAEQAKREREEAVSLARKLVEENNQLKSTVSKNQEALLEQAKKAAAAELDDAKAKYKAAYESGDSEALVNAQDRLTSATIKVDKVSNWRLPPLQTEKDAVQQQISAPAPSVDTRALDWQNENPWFGADDEMTSFALGLHQKLVKQGVDPKSDAYYEKINSRMRQVFPEQFESETVEDEPKAEEPRRRSIVAPTTRSVAPKKVKLSQSQVALAKRLGVPLDLYAKQVANELRK